MVRYYQKLEIAGTEYDTEKIFCRKGMNYRVGSFNAMIRNQSGEQKTSFSVGDDVAIYLGESDPAATKIWRGLIENIDFITTNQKEYILISGRDYGVTLMDARIRYETFSNQEASAIIKNLMDKYVVGVTYNNVPVTTYTPKRRVFVNKSVFDAIRDLANILNYNFYIDTDKDLHFEPADIISSGYTIDNTNIVNQARFKESRKDLYNDIYVYGGTQLIGWRNDFTADGAGSEFIMDYKPHNTYVTAGGNKQQGYISEMVKDPASVPSGTDYLISFDDQKIIFVSGTAQGDRIPASGTAIITQYDRDRAIIKNSFDNASITTYGRKPMHIVNKEISDPRQASDVAKGQLDLLKNPQRQGGPFIIEGIMDVVIGSTVVVDLPNQNVNSQTFKILDVAFDINKKTLLQRQVIKLTVSQRIKDITDKLRDIIQDIRKLQAADVRSTDIYTRLMGGTGSLATENSAWYIRTKQTGSSFKFGDPNFGKIGSGSVIQPILGSGTAGALTTVMSGGTFA